ncbi:MAG: hypothetical protein ABSD67_17460 [Terracidiphilus sp.]|jgi:hypothetical protein
MQMVNQLKWVGACCLAVLVALYVVGAVSHGSLRHEVQTLPLWVGIVAGFNRREFARWCALPCQLFWLVVMVMIWLFLLGWAHLISGHFSPVEIAMTIVVGVASAIGFALSVWRARWSLLGCELVVVFGVLQLLAFRISMLPAIAHQ